MQKLIQFLLGIFVCHGAIGQILPIQVGHWRDYTGGELTGITIQGANCFVTALEGSLLVFDLTHPAEPRRLASLPLIDYALDLTVLSNRAYVALGTKGLQIVDISDPAGPIALGRAQSQGQVWDVSVSWPYAYLASDDYGLEIINVTDPQNPIWTGGYKTGNSSGAVRVSGSTVFLGNSGNHSVKIFDITNPVEPKLLSSISNTGWPDDILVDGQRAFVAASEGRVLKLDISDPSHPLQRGWFGNSAYSLARKDSLLFASGFGDLTAFDISGTNVSRVGNYKNQVLNRDLALLGDYVVLASTTAGLQILDASNVTNLQLAASFPTSEGALQLIHHGNLALIPNQWDGLAILDLAHPNTPKTLSRYHASAAVTGAAVINSNTVVAALGDVGLDVIDITSPTNPVLVQAIRGVSVTSIDAQTNLLFVGMRTAFFNAPALRIMDFSDRLNPATLFEMPVDGVILQITLKNTFAYMVLQNEGFEVLNISNPASPLFVSQSKLPGITRLTLDRNFIHATTQNSNWQTFEVSNPSIPNPIATNAIGGQSYDVVVADSIAHVAAQEGFSKKILRYNVNDPRQAIPLPELLVTLPVGSAPKSLSIWKNNLYIASQKDGVWVYALVPPQTISISALSNPFRIQINSDPHLTADKLDLVEIQSSADLKTWSPFSAPRDFQNGLLTFTPAASIEAPIYLRAILPVSESR